MTVRRTLPWRCVPPGLMLLSLAACQAPGPPKPHAEIVRDELAQLVAAQQPPCGAVRVVVRHDRMDYRVECDSGRAYRVRVSGDGRVVVRPYDTP